MERSSNPLSGWKGFIAGLGLALIVAAVREELKHPSAERAWHGRLWGWLPYDFRPPTVARLRQSLWDPSSPRVITDRSFGIGWSVNVAALIHAIKRLRGSPSGPPAE
ncbi:MAG: hypothetical protein IT307_03750 [Chloroflexi bacterium]|nr:hypothetical protein [Chloroflexota bacterium]